jgi:UDP-N-acetylglucosamine 4,6-dehydratase/5-epimerase
VTPHALAGVSLVTGGTGSFGKTIVRRLLSEPGVDTIRVFSRDEGKQDALREEHSNDPRIEFVTGDVRDPESVETAMRGARWVFHAAALKQVPNCERFPVEALRTNALGSENVRRAAIRCQPEAVVAISTDKAVAPINAMGISKALMERILLRAQEPGSTTRFMCVRYGNVLGSRGSVVPLFLERVRLGRHLPITDPTMTRFLLGLGESVELAMQTIIGGRHGEVWVKKMPAATVEDIATAVSPTPDYPRKIVGIRAGEKLHEILVHEEEMRRTEEYSENFVIRPAERADGTQAPSVHEYTSRSTVRLDVAGVRRLLVRAGLISEHSC